MRRLAAALIALSAATALQATPALAAPQVLALLPSGGDIELHCLGGSCSAEFSTVCLQPDRASPRPGQAYTFLQHGNVTVQAVTEDGRRISLPADRVLTVESLRGHNAVRLSLSRQMVREAGLRSISVRVDTLAAIQPEAIAGDTAPQTDADIALASGPMQRLAEQVIAQDGLHAGAARIAASMVNALPRSGRVARALRGSVWAEATAASAMVSREAVALARSAYDQCERAVDNWGHYSFRQCLGVKHDSLVGTMNNNYWAAVKGAGS